MRLVVGTSVVDLAGRTVHRANGSAKLGAREAAVLRALAHRRGQVVGRAEVVSRVWGDRVVEKRTVDQVIRRLRKKLGDPAHLRTIAGQGYLLAADTSRSILAAPQGPLVGRDRELDHALGWMARPRSPLVILGPGGMGKTRLALEVARLAVGTFGEGAVFVPLAGVSGCGHVPAAIAAAIGAPAAARDLRQALWTRDLLLVLDNLEHLLPGLEPLLASLANTPGPALLCTSQVLPTGIPCDRLALDGLDVGAALQLFAHRLKHGSWFRDLATAEEGEARALCAMTGGSPLAIELAAATCRDRPVAEVRAAVSAALGTLAVAYPDMPPRQRSLSAAFQRSWELLDPAGRELLSRLGVFESSFTAAAARDVCRAGPAGLQQLVDHSLVRGGERYELHGVIRTFTRERVPPSAVLRTRHARHFLDALIGAGTRLTGPHQPEVLAGWVADLPDLERAWHHGLLHDQDRISSGLQALADLVEHSGRYEQGRGLLAPLLEHPRLGRIARCYHASFGIARYDMSVDPPAAPSVDTPSREAALVHLVRGRWYRIRGRSGDAHASFRAAHEAALRAGDPRLLRRALLQLASQCAREALVEEGLDHVARAQPLCEGDPMGRATLLLHRSWLGVWGGRLDRAHGDLNEAIRIFEALGNGEQVAICHHVLAVVAQLRDEPAEAAAHTGESVAWRRRTAPMQPRLANDLARLAEHLAACGRERDAREAATEALEHARKVDNPLGEWVAQRALAEVERLFGDPERAADRLIGLCERAPRVGASSLLPATRERLARILCALGRSAEAEPVAMLAVEGSATSDPRFGLPLALAVAFEATGDRRLACRALASASGRGRSVLRRVLQATGVDPEGDTATLEARRAERLAAWTVEAVH